MSIFSNNTMLPTLAGYRGISRLHDDIDRLFGGFFDRDWPVAPGTETKDLMPHLDFTSDEKAYTLAVELPGVEAEDVKIEVSGNELTISGEKREEVKNEVRGEKGDVKDEVRTGCKTHVRERRYGSFMRSITLPDDADMDSVKAVARNGVLTLEIARKAPEGNKVRSIEIQKG